MTERTLVISGIRPTFQMYDALDKHFTVALYDQASAQQLSAQKGQPITCPASGAGPPLFFRSRNDVGLMMAQLIDRLPSFGASLDGVHPADPPDSWIPAVALGNLPDVLAHLRIMDAYADTTNIVGIVLHEDVTPKYKALALWGKARGIPVIHVPHANCFIQTRPDVHDESVSDWILATSPYMREWYKDRGFKADCIKIVGFPAWDGWADFQVDKGIARRVLQLDEDKPVITFCTGWPQRTNIVDDHDMLEAAASITLSTVKDNDWQMIWKLHPGDAPEQEARCTKMAASYRVPAAITRDHLQLSIRAADLVLSAGPSNILVEAGLCDRAPALFNLRGYGFASEPPWIVDLTADSLRDAVESALEGSEWTKMRGGFVRRYAFRNDGKATKRAARQIKRIVS